MAYKINWSDKAEEDLEKIISYLSEIWTDREVKHFLTQLESVLKIVSDQPYMFRGSVKQNIREALITKHNLLLYEIREKNIELAAIWDTRQSPKKKLKLLKKL